MLRWLGLSLLLLILLALGGAGAGLYAFWHYGRGLPDYSQLADYEPPVTTRVHAGDGRLLAEYAREKRIFIPIQAIPKNVTKAFLSAEDKNFFEHKGVDPLSVLRAVLVNVQHFGSGRRPVGASTITQQVAKNFLLGNEVSIARKVREAILAFRIENALTKERILELYLNEIYLGFGSYGVAAAALNYFNKSLDQLTIAEAAFLAALPKAPNNYHPQRKPEAAKARRDWVIERMLDDGVITFPDSINARNEPLIVRQRDETETVIAEYFAEEVRRDIVARWGEKALYEGGLLVKTSLDPRLQKIADAALRNGLIDYDRRHGYRGPLERKPKDDPRRTIVEIEAPAGLSPWDIAVVTAVETQHAEILLKNGRKGLIAMSELTWARAASEDERPMGPVPRRPADVVQKGDVVVVEAMAMPGGDKGPPRFSLQQIPEVSGAIVAMDPHTGRVLAMTGGYAYEMSQFNRATQALRQPGSAFKTFVYLAALEQGFTPSTRILDGPISFEQGPGLPLWEPKNYDRKFEGPATFRRDVEKSRNVPTVRLAAHIGPDKVVDIALRFGIYDKLQPHLSFSLGAGETTVMRLTAAYAMMVNGGKRVVPSLIDRVQDRNGRTLWRHDRRRCQLCANVDWRGQEAPDLPDERAQVVDPATAYQMVNILTGVIDRGTATRLKSVGKPLAGKTGTSNDSNDTWFVGFTPDLAVGVYVGFDQPRSLGARETGGAVAAPVFGAFMQAALAEQPATPFRIPPGVRLVRVDPESGLPALPGARNVILESFRPGTEPQGPQPVLGQEGFHLPHLLRQPEQEGETAGILGGSEPGQTPSTSGLY
ncbi:MAG: penicillin-binding protein 1A [Alphaproteobacteria bacterium]|nr:penicillin-binding protein 1A [Alphaproteobacteria bacterium]